jgi:hypothetical protein
MDASTTELRGTATIDSGEPLPATLIIEQHYEIVRSNIATKPDQRWEHIDTHDHFHAYDQDGKLPTLVNRARHIDCDGTCGGVCEGEGYDITEWFCVICDEQVKPGRLDDHGPHSIPTRKDWTIKVETSRPITGDRVTVRFDLGEGKVLFGVAMTGGSDVTSERDYTSVVTKLYSAGPLGIRSVARGELTATR